MKHRRLFIWFVLVSAPCMLVSLIAEASEVGIARMDPRLVYRYFSVVRPEGQEWYVRTEEQNYTECLLRRKHASPTLSSFLKVKVATLPETVSSAPSLADYVRNLLNRPGKRGPVTSYKQKVIRIQNQLAVEYHFTSIDHDAVNSGGRDLTGKTWGFICKHPISPNVVVEAYYSVRGLPREVGTFTDAEARRILATVRLDIARDKPVQ